MATAPSIRCAAELIHPPVALLLELFHRLRGLLIDQLNEARRHATRTHNLEVFSKPVLSLLAQAISAPQSAKYLDTALACRCLSPPFRAVFSHVRRADFFMPSPHEYGEAAKHSSAV